MSVQPRVKLERLELHRETIRDLTEAEAENVKGGGTATLLTVSGECPPAGGKYGGPTIDTACFALRR